MQASLMVLFGQPPQLQHIVRNLRTSPVLVPSFLASRTPELGLRLKLAEQALSLLDCILQGSPNGASWAVRVLPPLRDLLSTGTTSLTFISFASSNYFVNRKWILEEGGGLWREGHRTGRHPDCKIQKLANLKI